MVVKSEIKHIRNLHQKKYRSQSGLFIAEGPKIVGELLQSSIKANKIYCTNDSWLEGPGVDYSLVSDRELKKMSSHQSPNKVLGIFHIPQPPLPDFKDWILVADSVQDPGNLGTIIRLCDWFGIRNLVCSEDTVDCYNPKVLQASMGSISRVHVNYMPLHDFLKNSPVPVWGAFMDGMPVYSVSIPASGILIMGNEAHGISSEIAGLITERIGIPPYGAGTTESLNVAMATAILLNEIRRPIQR